MGTSVTTPKGSAKFMFRRKAVRTILACALAIILFAGCGGGTPAAPSSQPKAAPPSQEVLTVADPIGSRDISTLDPALIADFSAEDMAEKMFPTLLVLQYSP